jgi:outer membrane lipoprotein-sorting protein
MKVKILSIIVIFFSFLRTDAKGQETADVILSKLDKTIFAITDRTAEIEMTMIDLKNQKQKVKKAILLQKGADKKLFRYTFPKNDAGIATLSLPNGEVYLYLPMFKKPKKITTMAESNAFNTSDFSLQDMATKPYAEEYTVKLVKTTDASFVLDLKPKADKPRYSRLALTVNKAHYFPEKIEFFDKSGQKVKESVYHHKKIGKLWVADMVTMKDLKKQHMTKLTMSNIKINQGLKDDLFTVENLASPK